MRPAAFLLGILFLAINSFSQAIPTTESIFPIHKKEKQQFVFFLPGGNTLKAVVQQMGVDLCISIYKKGDTVRQAYFDSPNGEFGPEFIKFETTDSGNYVLLVEPLPDDTASSGKYSIRLISNRFIRAGHDTLFANGSGIVIGHLNPLKIENLTNLCMIWGFLKYYHPAVARGDYNWDASLFRILPNILSSQSKGEAGAELEKWIDSLGKPDSCLTCKTLEPDSLVKVKPDYGYLFQKGNLSASLIEKLNYIKNNRNQDDNYYVRLADGIGNPVFDHEDPYNKMIYPDDGYRLLSLYRYWNIIQYFYPDKYVTGEDWNKILPLFIPKFVSAENATQYALACLEIIARIHDTHANIWSNNQALNEYFGRYEVPVQATFIDDKLVVTGYYIDTLSVKEKLKIGDVIVEINGQPVEKLVKNYLYLTPASNYGAQLRDMPYRSLLRSGRDTIELKIIRDRKEFSEFIPCVESGMINIYSILDPFPKDSSYKIINGNIGYLFPGRYHDRQLADIEKAFEHTKGLIIDMRTYPSAFMPFTFGAYIKPVASPFVKFTTGNVDCPGLFNFSSVASNGKTNPSFYKGPIVEIVNALTQSQAEYTTMAFQSAPNVTVIGSMTAGADGDVSPFYLPGGILTQISGIGVYYPNGDQTQRKGIKIDVEVKPTVEAIKNGEDQLLEKAIEMINMKASGH
jgi:C-terminal processing protease CtpA/Prc